MLGILPVSENQSVTSFGVFPDELNTLYIETQKLLEKYTTRATTETPLLLEELKSILHALDWIYEDLDEKSSERDIGYCLQKYKTYHSKLLKFDECLLPEVIEEYLQQEEQKAYQESQEQRERYARAEKEVAKGKLENKWIDDMRTSHYR